MTTTTSDGRLSHRPSGPGRTNGTRASLVFAVTAVGRSWRRSTCRSSTWPSPTSRRRTRTPARRRWRGSSPRYSIVFGALLVTGGRTGDRIGRRRTFLGGSAVFLVGSLLCGVAPNVPVLDRRPGAAGCGRRLPRAGVAGPADRRLPAGAPHADGRPVGRHRRAGGGHRPVAGRGHRLRRRLAVGVLREPSGRRWPLVLAGPARAHRVRASSGARPGPTTSASS